jgi:Cation efflux family
MAHYRKYMAAAAGLNTAISVGEAVGGYLSNSLSLIMDSVHNLADEMPLLALWLASPAVGGSSPIPPSGSCARTRSGARRTHGSGGQLGGCTPASKAKRA